MKTLTTRCDLCGLELQWPRETGLYAGVEQHYDYHHPAIRFDPADYPLEPAVKRARS